METIVIVRSPSFVVDFVLNVAVSVAVFDFFV